MSCSAAKKRSTFPGGKSAIDNFVGQRPNGMWSVCHIISTAGALRIGAVRDFRPTNHPLIAFEQLRVLTTKSTWKTKSFSENTFAGHWETVVYCMENIDKC